MTETAVTPPIELAQQKKKKTLIIWLSIAVFIGVEIWMAFYVHPSMSRVTELPHNLTHFFGYTIPFGGVNAKVLINTWLVMSVLIILAVIGRFRLQTFPGRRQGIFELIVEVFDSLCKDSLGAKLGRRYLPYILTVFFFILFSNWLLLFYFIPWVEEPTISLSTTLGMGTIAFFVSHITAIKEKGFLHYIQHYFEPMIEIGPVKIPNVLFFPIHVIGELGKVVSHSFRLFGNILGGGIIYVVVTALIRDAILPPALHLFFGIFVGAIQAFVFALLALTYIGILIASDEEEEAHAH